jgi:hypothetical protein
MNPLKTKVSQWVKAVIENFDKFAQREKLAGVECVHKASRFLDT